MINSHICICKKMSKRLRTLQLYEEEWAGKLPPSIIKVTTRKRNGKWEHSSPYKLEKIAALCKIYRDRFLYDLTSIDIRFFALIALLEAIRK